MDEREDWPEPQAGPGGGEMDIASLIDEAEELAAYVRWTLAWVDLTPESRVEVRRHAEAFRDLAEELRDIVRGIHPGLDD